MSSIAEYFKREGGDGHRCGYCKNPKGSISDGEKCTHKFEIIILIHPFTDDDFAEVVTQSQHPRNWLTSILMYYLVWFLENLPL